ncbi:ABC transporter substrate-binding protein [Oceanispirochaeta sp.]|jgi:ABC-type glycerol-3-phosphate transport system substrate-binding protein|uniref:ABC transporter substrate-binding protein n=1 Tax=Oceanispirochaeta sp. TaxID=2035350 RepID=UPI00261549A7|nr:ABC transporter substrate-binding protein [Oceanispirochaeta sp.]MDA3958899.1 ABC transporter substrate-binding protein [Oceanispirochaeta sp.]
MKKLLFVVTALLFAAASIPVFASGAQEEGSAKSNIIIYNSMHGDPLPREADEEVIKMFSEEYPDKQVIHSIVAHEDFKQAIRAYLSSSTPPDLLTWFAGNRARFFIDKGLIMDISDVWEEQGWNETYAKGWQSMSSVDGKKYFLPTSWYWWAVYYRPSVFEKYGLEAPKSWDEFMDVCDTLVANGVKPFAIGTKYRWTAAAWFDYFNMRINGPEFHVNLMLGKEKYDDPRVKKVFAEWGSMIDKGYFIDDPAAYSWSEAIPFMLDETAAMYLMGDFIRDSYPADQHDDLDFFRFPIYDSSVPVGEDAPTDGYFIPANTANPEGAKQLIAYFGSKEIQEYFAEKMGRLNTNSEVDMSLFNENQQKGIKMINNSDFVAQFYDRDTTPEMANKGMDAFMEIWEKHTKADIDRICARLEKDRQDIFTE